MSSPGRCPCDSRTQAWHRGRSGFWLPFTAPLAPALSWDSPLRRKLFCLEAGLIIAPSPLHPIPQKLSWEPLMGKEITNTFITIKPGLEAIEGFAVHPHVFDLIYFISSLKEARRPARSQIADMARMHPADFLALLLIPPAPRPAPLTSSLGSLYN